MRWHAALLFVAYSSTQQEGNATALPDALSSPRRQCTAVAVGPEFGGLALFAGGYTHGKGNDAASSGKAVDMFDKQGRRVGKSQLVVGEPLCAAQPDRRLEQRRQPRPRGGRRRPWVRSQGDEREQRHAVRARRLRGKRGAS